MHNKTRKNCIKLIKTIEKCKKVVYYEAINKEETGRGTTNNKGGGIVDRRDHDRCQELYVKYVLVREKTFSGFARRRHS